MALLIVGELAARRVAGQQMQQQPFAATVGRQRREAAALRAALEVKDGEGQRFAVDTTALDRTDRLRMRDEAGGDRLLPSRSGAD
jgi:hypothetical protein